LFFQRERGMEHAMKRKAVIIANGELGAAAAIRACTAEADVLIAADGGAQHCRELGLTPHLIVGDLDSLTPETRAFFEQAGTRFEVHPAHKDETDLELAVRAAQREGADEAVLVAALGARWDQSLANILLLAHPAFAPLALRLVEGPDTFWIIRDRATVRGQPGDRLSLLPLSPNVAGVTLTGLEYLLTDSLLPFGFTTGISNCLVAPEATITLQQGIVLAIHHQASLAREPGHVLSPEGGSHE
jgi:thiamine pyrophosphokinase